MHELGNCHSTGGHREDSCQLEEAVGEYTWNLVPVAGASNLARGSWSTACTPQVYTGRNLHLVRDSTTLSLLSVKLFLVFFYYIHNYFFNDFCRLDIKND